MAIAGWTPPERLVGADLACGEQGKVLRHHERAVEVLGVDPRPKFGDASVASGPVPGSFVRLTYYFVSRCVVHCKH